MAYRQDDMTAPNGTGDARRDRGIATRAKVLDAALKVFQAEGFAAASMDRIAACAGISKMTIYRKFADKEALFLAAINRHCAQIYAVNEHPPAASIEEARVALTEFGWVFADAVREQHVLDLYRMLLGEMQRFPQLGADFYDVGPARSIAVIENILSRVMGGDDARLRAEAFMHLVMGDRHQRLLLEKAGKEDKAGTDAAFRAQVDLAVRMVLGL
ncbi:TetR/AcrR family transcriptional regulator [Sphingomonas sp. SRS2]|uniref:TetR/AcrR family transcriptional regulator n=1 Tax=Sphingomonas sp. SRS2 TaxID=133190 RepID=UPI0006183FF6|nr:TetR/AcrR family transcriptional regulator [Sphingomonas sp. SRS2]KKC26993.1 hypothetical protein WP12_05900 [Sphingomonas sp. SRS2]